MFFGVFTTIIPVAYAQEDTQAVPNADEAEPDGQAVDAAENTEKTGTFTPPAERLRAAHQRLLSQAETEADPVWLDTPTPALAFWRDDMSGKPRGAVIILHDLGHNPLWPKTVQNLHDHLPRHGWSTLSVYLEALPAPTPPKRPPEPKPTAQQAPPEDPSADPNAKQPASENDEPSAEPPQTEEASDESTNQDVTDKTPSTEELLAEVKSTNQSRLQSAVRFLRDKGRTNIALIGVGYGGHLALAFSGDQNDKPQEGAGADSSFSALVTVNTDNHYPWSVLTQNLINQPTMPTFEVVTNPLPRVQADLQKRKLQSRKQQYPVYRQRTLHPLKGTLYRQQETELTKVIRGFLTRFAAEGKTAPGE